MFKKLLCFGVICGCLTLSGCRLAKEEFGTDHCHFRLIEDVEGAIEGLYVHEETGVIYYKGGDKTGLTALIKPDGSAYTLEDFEMDKKGE